MKDQLVKVFKEKFGSEGDIRSYFAPGRVNLIGEHTDYNGGHVFPCALTIGTYAIVRKREDRNFRFYSTNFESLGVIEASLDNLKYDKALDWTNYPLGVVWAIIEKGYPVDCGFDMLLFGNIPNGSGLSSSASVEVVTGVSLRDLFGYDDISMKGIGYKEIIGSLEGKYTIDEAIELIKKNTRHYAKRQLTWLRRYDNIKWFNLSSYEDKAMAMGDILKWLRTNANR